MTDEPLSDEQRVSLRYYLATEDCDVTPWFVLRFYHYDLIRWGRIFLLAAFAVMLFTPPGIEISLRTAMLTTIGFLFVGLVALSVRTSFASVEHWRLLRRVLDWDAVRRLHDSGTQNPADNNQFHGSPRAADL